MGCGNKPREGYINADIFEGPNIDEVFEFDNVPYLDGTISAISSEHALEHVGWKRSDRALQEWTRVLKPGGELHIKIPEFEDCCIKYIESGKITDTETRNQHKLWYKYTMHGIQDSQAGEPDEAQFHLWGWSLDEMCDKLKGLGYDIIKADKYNCFDTPSMEIIAVKR